MTCYVESGVTGTGIILNDNSMSVSSGGTVNSTTVNDGGNLTVSSAQESGTYCWRMTATTSILPPLSPSPTARAPAAVFRTTVP